MLIGHFSFCIQTKYQNETGEFLVERLSSPLLRKQDHYTSPWEYLSIFMFSILLLHTRVSRAISQFIVFCLAPAASRPGFHIIIITYSPLNLGRKRKKERQSAFLIPATKEFLSPSGGFHQYPRPYRSIRLRDTSSSIPIFHTDWLRRCEVRDYLSYKQQAAYRQAQDRALRTHYSPDLHDARGFEALRTEGGLCLRWRTALVLFKSNENLSERLQSLGDRRLLRV